VLASTKDHAHRIYLAQASSRKVTLFYKDRRWQHRDWTLADIAAPITRFFSRCREHLRAEQKVVRMIWLVVGRWFQSADRLAGRLRGARWAPAGTGRSTRPAQDHTGADAARGRLAIWLGVVGSLASVRC